MREKIKDDDLIGTAFESAFGVFTVLSKIEGKQKHKRFKIEFEEYFGVKYSYLATKDNILNNRVRNPYYPIFFNIACTGEIDLKDKKIEYQRWKMMLYRCYDTKNKDYKTYGNKGVIVCPRWLCFENYYEDFSLIEGYSKENIHNLVLDKDIKSNENKIYSLETCKFISSEENGKEALKRRQKLIIGIDENNNKFEFFNQREFAQIHDLQPQSINSVLKNRAKTHKGWQFYYKGDN